MGDVSFALRSLRRRLRGWIGQHPALYLPLVAKRRRAFDGSRKAVGPDTELVIEGFPRCGNSFAFAAFAHAQQRPVSVAHHLHAPAQIVAAARRGIPTLVVIRRPDDAVLSLLIRAPRWEPRTAYAEYIRFYDRIQPHRAAFVVAPFEEVTRDFGRVIRRLNQRFGTSFAEFAHTPGNVASCFEHLEHISRVNALPGADLELSVARPSATREQRKTAEAARLRAPALHALRARAEALYRVYMDEEDRS